LIQVRLHGVGRFSITWREYPAGGRVGNRARDIRCRQGSGKNDATRPTGACLHQAALEPGRRKETGSSRLV